MEGLKKLEEIHRMMMFIESQGIISPSCTTSHSDSHRFLAHFLLFLKEPCGELSVDDKCRLISEHLPKILPSSFPEETFLVLPAQKQSNTFTGKGFRPARVSPRVDQINGGGIHGHGSEANPKLKNMALIGMDAMERANSTLEDFCRSYFMFHGLDVKSPEILFKYLPVLSFTESYIYQLDSLNEKMVKVARSSTVLYERSHEESYSSWEYGLMEAFESDPFRPLTLLLEHNGLMTEQIREELRYGEEYWGLERKLCSALVQQLEIAIEDVMRAIHLKSFDYRVLNLLLYLLRGEEVNDLHMEFLSVSEFLVEISDDLFDYEEDVLENNFNILRMFVRIYGSCAAPTMLAKSIAEAEEKYEELSKALDPKLCLSYQRRCEEATKEGGKISGHLLGSWSIPPLIVDEELYRSTFLNSPNPSCNPSN